MSTTQIKCPSCGAPIDLERGQHIVRCSYCNCDVALDEQARKAVEAEAILGFPYAAVTEDELQTTALLWISKAENMPLDFSKEACFSRCVLYYAPVYIQDIHYSASYQAQIGINQTHAYTEFNKGKRYRRHETITNWRLAKGDVEGDAHIFAFGCEVSRIPGIEQVTAGRIGYIGHETIEPQALYPTDIARATIIPRAEPSAEEIESKLSPFIQKEVYKALSGDKQKNVRWNLKKKIRKQDCVYVPLWSVVFTYKGSDYSFIIDGCVPTEIYGIRPEDVSTQQAIKQAFIPAKVTLWAGIASFVLALIFHTATLNIVGALLLIGAAVFHLAAKRKARLLKQPGADLQEKLQLLYSDSTLTLQEKQTRAVRLVDEAYAAIVEQDTAIPSTAGGKKLVRLSKKAWILSLGAVFVIAAFYLAISSSKSHSASDNQTAHRAENPPTPSAAEAFLESVKQTSEPVVTPQVVPDGNLTQYFIEGGTGHISLKSGYYDANGVLYLEDQGIMKAAAEIYDIAYRAFNYEPEYITVKDMAGKEYSFDASYIADFNQYYIFSDRTNEWIQLSQRFIDGFTITVGVHKDVQGMRYSENAPFDPVGIWECIGIYERYTGEEEPDYYQTIPDKYMKASTDALELHIDADTLTQIVNGEEDASFSWNRDGRGIDITTNSEIDFFWYYQVDENTIHEFYADSMIYIYTRKGQ